MNGHSFVKRHTIFSLSGSLARLVTNLLDKSHRLDASHIKPLPAADVLAAYKVVPSHHITLGLGKPGAVPVISSTRQLSLLPPHQPGQLVLPLLPAMRAGHDKSTLFRPFIKKMAHFHPA